MAKHSTIQNPDLTKIQASPTKDFFISMLTKDITLIDAIGDLIDNSVDGANRMAQLYKLKNLNNFIIKIKTTSSKFEIEDNCGGIDIDVARKYAFRFGRPAVADYKIEHHSIGQFGIGMKRAFFKIGNIIEIKSVSRNSKFETTLNVDEWRAQKDWDFSLVPYAPLPNIPLKNRGTTIIIKNLTKDSKNNFGADTTFETNLIDEISYEHLFSIKNGLKIYINGNLIKEPQLPNLTLIYDKDFKPSYWHKKFDTGLSVEIFTGISEDKGNEGGWYIFCNDRLITGPDTSKNTGWTGSKGKDADGVAVYHDQFYRFRGYVFFNSNDASKLPWNTTKTAMDMDSGIYQYVRQQMIQMMKPVMTLMNKIKKEKEKDKPKSERLLNYKVEHAKIVSITKILELKEKKKLSDSFIYPIVKSIVKSGAGKIIYQKPLDEIDKVKKYFGVTKLSEVGEATFDYFYNRKIGK